MNLRAKFCLFLDILGVICGVALIATLFSNWIFYRWNFDFPDRFIQAAFIIFMVRVLLTLDYKKLRRSTDFHYDTYVIVTVLVIGLCMWHSLYESMHHATRGVAILRGSFANVSDEVISEEVTNLNQYYPNYQFLHAALREIPEDANIALIGDMRGHLITYDVYPRKLYMLEEAQIVLNKNAMECYAWKHVDDPIYPLTDPFATYTPYEPKSDEEVQRLFKEMIEEKDIDWVICYSTIYPEKSFFKKIK